MNRYMLVALASIALAQDTKQTEQEGIPILPLHGKIHIYTSRLEPVEKETLVGQNDRIGTATGDAARFSTEGGLVVGMKGIKVAQGTGLGLSRNGGRLVLQLFEGNLVVESYESEIEVKTPHGRVEGKQVYFVVQVTEKATRVIAFEGKLTFTHDLGGTTTVDEGAAMDLTKKTGTKVESPDLDWVSAAEGPNLIKNPGFEEGMRDWNSRYPPLAEDTKIVHSGKRSYKHVLQSVNPNSPLFPPQEIKGPLRAGSKYMLRFFIRTEKFMCDDKPAQFKLMIDLTGVAREKWPDTKHHYQFSGSDGAWTSRKVIFEAAGTDVAFGMDTGRAKGKYSGTVWFDDFALREVPAAPKSK